MKKHVYHEVPVGYELEPVAQLLTPEMSKDFSGWPDWRNFHTDEEIAKDIGFPSLLAQGALVACYISKMCLGFFGERWFTHGELKVQFKKPVFTPHRISAQGRLANRSKDAGGGTRITLEVWVEDEAGQKVQTGTASCVVP